MGSVQFRGELPLTTIPAVRDRTLYPSFSSSHPLPVCSPLPFNEGEAEGGVEKEKQRKIERENLHACCVQAHLLQSSNPSCSLGIKRHIFLSALFCCDLIFCQMMQWHQNQQWIIVGIFNHQLNIMAASMFFLRSTFVARNKKSLKMSHRWPAMQNCNSSCLIKTRAIIVTRPLLQERLRVMLWQHEM